MSGVDDPPGDQVPAAPTQEVGYKKPPVEHQFKKGVSGNPRGRPRKPKARRATRYRPSTSDLLISEAYKPITIRENNETITMPMFQAVLRSLGIAAVKGSHRAQVAITNLLQAAEQKEVDDRKAIFEAIVDYKKHWGEVFEYNDRIGKPRPDPVPHPDDLAINSRTGEVIYNGPFDEAEKAAWDKFKQHKAEALEEIEQWTKAKKRKKDNPELFDRMIAIEQRTVDLVDRTFPDEEARRQPDFNIHEWRDRQAKLQALRAKSRMDRRSEAKE